MKYNDYQHHAADRPDGWRNEMEQHLLLWDRLGYRKEVPAKGTAEEARMWEQLLPLARPVPPRTCLAGARTAAELRNLDWKDLESSGEMLIEGERVGIRWLRRENDISSSMGAHGWEVLFTVGALDDDSPQRSFLERFFRTITVVDQGYLASEEHLDRRSALVPLASLAFSKTSTQHWRHCWGLAHALGIRHEFLELLDEGQRVALGTALADELKLAGDSLEARYDVRLAVFAEGHSPGERGLDWPQQTWPTSALELLWRRSKTLSRLHRELGNQYFEDLCFDAALLLGVYSLADLLKEMPVGWTSFAGYDGISRYRPQSLASLLWHPSTKVQGMFALTRLPTRIHSGDRQDIDLSEEWQRVQHLGRKLFLLDNQCPGDEALALGLNDFSHHLATQFWGQRGLDAGYWSKEIWDQALERDTFSRSTTACLAALLQGDPVSPSDTVFVFALQQLERLGELERPDQQKVISAAFVSAYKQSVNVRDVRPRTNFPLPAFGTLLACLWGQLESEPELRTTLVAPFELDDLIALGKQRIDENELRNYWHDVKRTFENHASFLLAIASEVSEPRGLLDAVVVLYLAAQQSELPVLPFDWSSMANERRHAAIPGVDPLFKRLAQQAASVGAGDILRRVLESKPAVHVLAALRSGLNQDGALRSEVENLLQQELDRRHLAGDLALGETLDLAAVLNSFGWGSEAQRCAEHGLNLLNNLSGSAAGFDEEAQLASALAYANQKQWRKILELELKGGGLERHLFVRNLKAAAHLELGEVEAAKGNLEWVLQHAPENEMAVSNYCALLVRDGRWQELQALLKSHLDTASAAFRSKLLVIEATALEETGDSEGAALSLRAAGDLAIKGGGAFALAKKVLSGSAYLQSGGPTHVARVLYCEGEETSLDRQMFKFLLTGHDVSVIAQGRQSQVLDAVRRARSSTADSKSTIYAGIVDRDQYPQKRLESLAEDVELLPVNEVESVLCHPEVVAFLARKLGLGVPSEGEVLEALRKTAQELRSGVAAQRAENRKGADLLHRSRAIDECLRELDSALCGTVEELLQMFPGKELLPAVSKWVGEESSSVILEKLAEHSDDSLSLEFLSNVRGVLLKALQLELS